MFDWNTKVLFCRSTTIEKTKNFIAILWGADFSTVAASKTNGSWIAYIHCKRLWLHVTEKWAPCLERRHAFFQCLMVDANAEDRLECSMLFCDDWWKIVSKLVQYCSTKVGFGLSNATQQFLSLYQILLFEIWNYMFMVELKGFEIICLWIWRVGSWRKDRE